MRVYADTSFLVKLLVEEPDTAAAVSEYRGLGRPPMLFLPLHELEVANAIRQRAFHQRHTSSASEKAVIRRECDAALNMLRKFIARQVFVETVVDMELGILRAQELSAKHTERIGCRGFDLLHVALALELECDTFLTADRNQAVLARAEGLKVRLSAGA